MTIEQLILIWIITFVIYCFGYWRGYTVARKRWERQLETIIARKSQS